MTSEQTRAPEPEFLEDDVVELEEPAGRGRVIVPWVLFGLTVAAFAAFLFSVHLPTREDVVDIRAVVDENAAAQESADAALAAAEARATALRGELDTLRAEFDAANERTRELAHEVDAKNAALTRLREAHDALRSRLQTEIDSGNVAITERDGKLIVDVSDRVLFATGRAELSEHGREVIRQVADTLRGFPDREFQIGGHTDSTPLSAKTKEVYPTNWELSTTRATNVVRFLQEECSVPGKQLIAAGFSQYQPVAKNKTAKGKQRNRRIEIVMLP